VRIVFWRGNRTAVKFVGEPEEWHISALSVVSFLKLVNRGVRHRTLRVLGLDPKLIDVLRVWWFVGAYVAKDISSTTEWFDVSDRQLFLDTLRVFQNDKTATWGVFKQVTDDFRGTTGVFSGLSTFNSLAHSGGDVRIDRGRLVSSDLDFGYVSPACCVLHLGEAQLFRIAQLRSVLEKHAVFISAVPDDVLNLVTTCSGMLDGNVAAIRQVRLWEALGDVFMKLVSVMLAVEAQCDLATYSGALTAQSNARLTELVSQSGLRVCFEMGMLSGDSKANADVFEALVGAVAWYEGVETTVRLLALLHVVSEADFPVLECHSQEVKGVLSKMKYRLAAAHEAVVV